VLRRHDEPQIVINLPADVLIVECRADVVRKGLVFTIRSREFPRVARGALIPELEPRYNGLKYCAARRGGPVIVKS